MLTKRLKYIVDVIPNCDVLADVGCDHGYVGIEALKRGVAGQVVFTDISSACLTKARLNCPTPLQEQATFVCQDGLGAIECNTAVICGMGGLEILSILNAASSLPKTIVLQPMRNIVDVRKYVSEHYIITHDVTVYDGKFYAIMVGERLGEQTRPLSELELEFGITNINEPSDDFICYLQHEHTKLTRILDGCKAVEVSSRLELINRAIKQTRRKI